MEYLNIAVPNQDGINKSLKEYSGKYVVLYFYPKDNTPGCTVEAIDFTTKKAEFEDENAVIIGVSKDSVSSHQRFCQKKNLEIELLSDEELSLIKAFDVWKLKKMAGREYMGIVRSTFILNPDGEIVKSYPKVRVKGHVEEVLADLKEIKG